MKKLSIFMIPALLLIGCVEEVKKVEKLDVKLEFSEFPKKYTCDGEDISPKIEISGLRNDVKSLVIIVDDPDAPMGTFTHWIAWNVKPVNEIPENIPKIPEVSEPITMIQGKNDFGKIGYNGPCPPSGVHRYFFKIYALDVELNLPAGSDRKNLEREMSGHIIQYGEAMAKYSREW